MIISDKEAASRLNSPSNLINKLRDSKAPRSGAMNLFGIGKKIEIPKANGFVNPFNDPRDATQSDSTNQEKTQLVPFAHRDSIANNGNGEIKSSELRNEQPQIEDLIDNSDQQIQLAKAHNTALTVLNEALTELSIKLPDMKADKLPSAIAAASKTVESIRKERRENARQKNEGIHLHIYAPQQNPIEQYSVIEVG